MCETYDQYARYEDRHQHYLQSMHNSHIIRWTARLKGDVQRYQQQTQDCKAKLMVLATSHPDESSIEALKEQLAAPKQDLQVAQRSLALPPEMTGNQLSCCYHSIID
jgi:hypothetical protein